MDGRQPQLCLWNMDKEGRQTGLVLGKLFAFNLVQESAAPDGLSLTNVIHQSTAAHSEYMLMSGTSMAEWVSLRNDSVPTDSKSAKILHTS
jgi:hypothetical protein